MYTLFSIIQSDDTLFKGSRYAKMEKKIYITTRWVKVRRKNDSKEKTKEIRRKKEKVSHVNSDLFHLLPVAINYAV